MALAHSRNFSNRLLVRLPAKDVAMFRFLLEAHENMAIFTTLQMQPALLKISFACECRNEVIKIMEDMKRCIDLQWQDWPVDNNSLL